MTNLSHTNQNGWRPRTDHYGTTPDATRSFVAFERRRLKRCMRGSPIWEPAAGEGYLAAELNACGFATVETDKYRHTRLPGRPPLRLLNFLHARELVSPVIATNPPYNEGHSGDAFVRHALLLRPRYAAFLLPIGFLAGKSRRDLLDEEIGGLRHARTLVITWRLTLHPTGYKPKNSGVTIYAWLVWERGHKGPSTTHRLYRADDVKPVSSSRRPPRGLDCQPAEGRSRDQARSERPQRSRRAGAESQAARARAAETTPHRKAEAGTR